MGKLTNCFWSKGRTKLASGMALKKEPMAQRPRDPSVRSTCWELANEGHLHHEASKEQNCNSHWHKTTRSTLEGYWHHSLPSHKEGAPLGPQETMNPRYCDRCLCISSLLSASFIFSCSGRLPLPISEQTNQPSPSLTSNSSHPDGSYSSSWSC